ADSLKRAAGANTSMTGRALLDLARVQVGLKHKTRAIATLDKALKYDHVAAPAARLAGDLCYGVGDYETSAKFYLRIVTHHQSSDDFAPAVIGLLWSHYSAGRYQAAVDAWGRYHKMLSGGAATAAAYLAGSSQQRLGTDAAAAAMLLKVAAQGPAPHD